MNALSTMQAQQRSMLLGSRYLAKDRPGPLPCACPTRRPVPGARRKLVAPPNLSVSSLRKPLNQSLPIGWPLSVSFGRRICTRCEGPALMRLCAEGRMKELAAEFRLSSTEPDRGKSSSANHCDQTLSRHPPAGQACRQSRVRCPATHR